MEPVQILVADPHRLVRDITAHRIAEMDGYKLVGSVCTGAETLQAVADQHPDLLLLALDFQDLHGIRVISALKDCQEAVRILVLGCENRPDFIRCVLDAGADAYLLKDEATDLLPESIVRLSSGEKGWFRPISILN
jgi:two-component system, NarL family, nitrate/nitrite response regulator NarP